MKRIAVKDVTLCDGTRIPRGTVVAAAADAMHHDEAVLKNARTLDAFRYARMRSTVPEESARHQFASASPEYIAWGYGPQAWCVCLVSSRLVHRIPSAEWLTVDGRITMAARLQPGEVLRVVRAEGDPGAHHPRVRPEAGRERRAPCGRFVRLRHERGACAGRPRPL